MRILHIANFSLFKNESVFYSIDRKISNGLIRNGHFVADFSYRDISKHFAPLKIKKLGINKMCRSIFKTIDSIEPELILFGHSELITFSTIKSIKEKYPNVKLAMWWVDWLKNLSSINSKIDYLDVLFITTGIKDFDKNLIKNKKIKVSYIPNMSDISIESYKAFENKKYSRDVFFAGRLDEYRENFLNRLKNSLDSNISFDLFGTTKDNLLLGNKFLKEIGNSKISINLSRDHNTSLYTSDRIAQLMANGSLVLSKNIPDFDMLFNENEIVFFDDIIDCKEKIEFYLNNDLERKEISSRGWEKVHNSYNSTRVAKFMLETIFDNNYSEEYEWKKEIIMGQNEKNTNN